MDFGWTSPQPARHSVRVTFLLVLLAAWFGGSPSWAAAVQRVDVSTNRVVITFDGRVSDASAFVLDEPRRIAVDVGGASPGAVGDVSGGPVNGVRQGARGGDGARIVLDLARPAIVTKGSLARDGRKLTLALATVDDAQFARAAAEGRMSILPPFNYVSGSAGMADSSSKLSMAVPPPAPGLSLPHIYGDDATRPLVVIDAGHGGYDPGAISGVNGLREKDVTLKLALAIRDKLVASGKVRVALTREDDRFLILEERRNIARKLGADLFISIHCDSATVADASGATVYTLSEIASDKEAARLAARENKADIIAGVDLGDEGKDISSILIDLSQRETMNVSAGFASLLGREAKGLIPVKPNYHRMASLVVLKAPDMPSILFETGYISNADDVKLLASADGRSRIAESVKRAVEIHFARRLASRDRPPVG